MEEQTTGPATDQATDQATEGKEFIVAEVTKNWVNGTDEGMKYEGMKISRLFEFVIETNLKRGYVLHSHTYTPLYIPGDRFAPNRFIETIIAVFRKQQPAKPSSEWGRRHNWKGVLTNQEPRPGPGEERERTMKEIQSDAFDELIDGVVRMVQRGEYPPKEPRSDTESAAAACLQGIIDRDTEARKGNGELPNKAQEH